MSDMEKFLITWSEDQTQKRIPLRTMVITTKAKIMFAILKKMLDPTHHHHHFLLSLRGHRASTKRHHLILFLAIFLILPQLIPFSNASLWTDLLHVCLGLSLLLFPRGFQSKASLLMASFPFLNVCPIHCHFCLLTCMDILS